MGVNPLSAPDSRGLDDSNRCHDVSATNIKATCAYTMLPVWPAHINTQKNFRINAVFNSLCLAKQCNDNIESEVSETVTVYKFSEVVQSKHLSFVVVLVVYVLH
jgi:hypothetical protein